MLDHAPRAVHDLQAALPNLEAQIEILVALEIVLVETAHRIEQLPLDQDSAAAVDLALARLVDGTGGIVAPGIGIGVDRRLEIGAGVERIARRIDELRPDNSRRGQGALHLDKGPQPVAARKRVVVEKHQILAARLARSEIVATRKPVIDRLPDEPHLRIRPDRVLEAGLLGTVGEDNHFVLVDERVLGDCSETGSQYLQAVPVQYDDAGHRYSIFSSLLSSLKL